jgi:hypothetical protein
MNKKQIIDKIYPENENMFSYDTALPLQTLNHIMEKCYPHLDQYSTEYGEKRMHLYNSVYCYDKENRSEGFLPLTFECMQILKIYNRECGYDVIFTPLFSTYETIKDKQYKSEYKELLLIPGFDANYIDYKESRENGRTFNEIKNWFQPK